MQAQTSQEVTRPTDEPLELTRRVVTLNLCGRSYLLAVMQKAVARHGYGWVHVWPAYSSCHGAYWTLQALSTRIAAPVSQALVLC